MSPGSLFRRLASSFTSLPSSRSELEAVKSAESSATAKSPINRELLAKIYKVGDGTLDTYFKWQLSRVCTVDGSVQGDIDWNEAGECDDLFTASLGTLRTTSEQALPPAEVFVPLLRRCVTGDIETIKGADEYMEEMCGISALTSPALHQMLVALAVKHRNLDLLAQLVKIGRPLDHNIFCDISPEALNPGTLSSVFDDPAYANIVWSHLFAAGWVGTQSAMKVAVLNSAWSQQPDPEAGLEAVKKALGLGPAPDAAAAAAALESLTALFFSGYNPEYYTGTTLRLLVTSGTSLMLVRFLPLISRVLYDSIPPHQTWPGDPGLVTLAAARSDSEGLAILRVLVELGGMDVNIAVWYKSNGDGHAQAFDSRLPDQSCTDETPLHAAVQNGSAETVRYLLLRGAQRVRDAWGRDQLQRATVLGKGDVVQAFEKHGWKS